MGQIGEDLQTDPAKLGQTLQVIEDAASRSKNINNAPSVQHQVIVTQMLQLSSMQGAHYVNRCLLQKTDVRDAIRKDAQSVTKDTTRFAFEKTASETEAHY